MAKHRAPSKDRLAGGLLLGALAGGTLALGSLNRGQGGRGVRLVTLPVYSRLVRRSTVTRVSRSSAWTSVIPCSSTPLRCIAFSSRSTHACNAS